MSKMYAENVKIEFDQLKRYPSEREALKDKGFRLVGRIAAFTVAGKVQPGRVIYQDKDENKFALISTDSDGYKIKSVTLRKFVGNAALIIKM